MDRRDPSTSASLPPAVAAVVGAAQRRLWWVTTCAHAQRWGAWPALACAAWLAAVRWLAVPASSDGVAVAVLVAIAAAVAARVVWHRHGALDTAVRLDRRAQTHDLLATAVWLDAQPQRDGWTQVQHARAAEVAGAIDVTRLWPWPSWRRWLTVAMAAGLLGGVAWWPLPVAQPSTVGLTSGVVAAWPAQGWVLATARTVLGEDAAQLLRADVRLLREIEEQVADEPTRRWLGELRQVVEAVQAGQIDKRQALEQLAALEAKRPRDEGVQDPAAAPAATEEADERQRQRDVAARDAILQAASKAIAEAPQGEAKEALQQAVQQGDVGLLAKALEKLASGDMSDKDIEKWLKTLEKFADSLRDRKVPEQLKQFAEKVRRLEDQRARQGGLNPSDQRRLQQARHELEQLRKQVGDVEGAQHQVQRLERQARQAADELRRQQAQAGSRLAGGGQQAGGEGEAQGAGAPSKAQQAMREVMRRAADELRRQDDQHKARQAQRMGQQRLRDLREGLSRGQGGEQQRQAGEQGREQAQPRDAQGPSRLQRGGEAGGADSPDKRGAKGSQARDNSGDRGEGEAGDTERGAGAAADSGNGARDKGFRLGSKGLGGKSRTELINEGYDEASDSAEGRGQQGPRSGAGQGGSQAGDAAAGDRGDGRPPGVQAARTEKLKGVQGNGPDIKQTFMEAARKGFARVGWREIYADYSQVAEEMLDKESLPPGRKALVRRYFEQIRPRQ